MTDDIKEEKAPALVEDALDMNNEEAEATIQSEDRFERMVERLENKLKLMPLIGKQASDVVCLVSLARSYVKKEYSDIPVGTIVSVVSTLLYIIAPIDVIPDAIPVLGAIDDLALLTWIFKSISSDVEEYKKWRAVNKKQIIEAV